MSAQAQPSVQGVTPGAASYIPWREVTAASVGNALEFYDLVIYGYFAVVLSKLFFPAANETVSLMLAVGTFGISFVMRPLGAIVLGSFADRAGRKASLTLSIALIMLGTLMLVFAPTYAQIGVASPLLILFARLIQGFSTGGEFGASTAFMVEYASAGRRGFFGSWQASTQGVSTVFAAGVAALLSYVLTPAEVSAWGWRVAFGIGLLIGPVGFYIRRRIDETPEFRDAAAGKLEKSPFKAVLRRDWRSLLLGIGVVAGSTGFNYVHKVYMPTYALTQLHFPPVSSYLGAAVTGLVQAIAGPMFGALSDRVGRRRLLWVAFPLVCVTTYPMFLTLNTWPAVATLIAVQAFVGLLNAACLAPISALLAEIFPTGTRSTGLALSYNLSVTLFGGFAPLIATSLIAATGNKLAPSYYVMGSSLLSIAAIAAMTYASNAARRIRAAEPG
jgi:MHS family proline/betaine transporter-like MFS transporter